MSNSSHSGDKILLYYKILSPSSLNSVAGSKSSDFYPQSTSNSNSGMDSTDYDFMCTLVDSQNVLSVSDFTKFLSNFLHLSNYSLFFKVLVPLDTYFPGSLSMDSLEKLSELNSYTRSHNLSKSDSSNHFLNQDTCNPSNSFNYSTALNMDFRKDMFHNFLGKNGNTNLPFVWVSPNPSDPIPSIDGTLYLKIYLFDKLNPDDSTNSPHSDLLSGFPGPSSPSLTTSHPKTSQSPSDFSFLNAEDKSPFDLTHKSPSSSDTNLQPSDRDTFTDIVSKWSLSPDGKLKDIRSLLSTLQNVLWDDVSWEPMPISLLVSDKNSIRPYYRKALLVCHPDKQGITSPSRKLLCELIIQTLMKSWSISY